MPGFADSFWSDDYAGGLGVLFGKLQQGVSENLQVLTLAKMTADAEEAYGAQLSEIAPAVDKISGGFSRDDGASVRKAFEGVNGEMAKAAKSHKTIASNIRELVVSPFGRWSQAHEARVLGSHEELLSKIKHHDKQADVVRKLRGHYFNKCRLVEDMEEENKLAFQEPAELSPKLKKEIPIVKVVEEPTEEEELFEIGDEVYNQDKMKKIITNMLETIPLNDVKIAILGTYSNVSTGVDISEYIQKHLNATSISQAERIGQDLVSNGFLRLIGNVGNTFANSSKMNYQWRPRAFTLTGIPEKKKPLMRSSTGMSSGSADSQAIGDYLAGWNPLNNPYPNETPVEKLRREANDVDTRYKASVRKLDMLRCNLEETMMDHLKFMERCELDRLKAIKSVILDFSGSVSNVIPSLQSTVDNMMLYQETVQPLGDLRYLLENYRTGAFVPKVQVYENYYNAADEQTFGVDLEARARADRKRVPLVVTAILTFLDNHYPDLEGDEARRGIWLVDVPLAATHHLRNAINTGKPIPRELLEEYELPIIASALKLYLLELPDSLVSSHFYEVIKTIYSIHASETADATRISVIQNTLGQLRLSNIATLDAITIHFTRVIELTSADETFISALAHNLAPCILRPRNESPLTVNERYSYRLIRDLLAHKEEIFGELKRASSLHHTLSGTDRRTAERPRAISTDESNRRANMEARQAAIASRSRAPSPAPSPGGRGHRRDRSSGGSAATRFPIQTSPTSTTERKSIRQSLEVPGSQDNSPVTPMMTPNSGSSIVSDSQHHHTANGTSANGPGDHVSYPTDADGEHEVTNKRNSIGGRISLQGSALPSGRYAPRKQPGVVAGAGGGLARHAMNARENMVYEEETRPVGVILVDKPMDD
ncbi:MAG: hypothetical protein M1829_004181 [Trizodia sp. TS-e1964]|nr:MAG: hypothetical protein M1829_004181 [Trizodia sp. TS-e1964]